VHLDEIFELVPERPWGEQMMETNEGNDASETIDAPSRRDAPDLNDPFGRKLEAILAGFTPAGIARNKTNSNCILLYFESLLVAPFSRSISRKLVPNAAF
jgi:hypothetical protein